MKYVFSIAFMVALSAQVVLADEGRGRSSKLTPPDGAPYAEARGVAVLNANSFIVNVEGLPAGDYSVVVGGTEMGTLSVLADDEDDADVDVDDEDDGGGSGGEDPPVPVVLGAGHFKVPAGTEGVVAGAAIEIKDSSEAKVIVLAGSVPNSTKNEPEPKSGRCALGLPDPAVDADAEGVLKLETGDDRMVIKAQLKKLEPETLYEVIFTNPAGDASESLGTATTNRDGEAQLKVDSEKGDAIPFNVASLADLAGYSVKVVQVIEDGDDPVVLVGVICAPQVRPGGNGDDDHGHGEKPPKPRCFTAALAGAEGIAGTGTGQFDLGGRDGLKLEYKVTVEGLTGPATGANIHAADDSVLVPLDAATLAGEAAITQEQADAIRAGGTYVNVLTEANPAGEIRGNLVACVDDDEDDDEGGNEAVGGGGSLTVTEEPLFLLVGDFDTPFIRGDVNGDNQIDLSDPVNILLLLFAGGGRPYCMDSADPNDDGRIDVADPIALLGYLFQGGAAPAYPGILVPGTDRTPDALFCEELR